MKEPVKIVVFVEGGVVQGVMTCGAPAQVAVIDADIEDEDAASVESYPEVTERPEHVRGYFKANGFVWDVRGDDRDANAYAMECFNIAAKANGVGDDEKVEVPRWILAELVAYAENSTLEEDELPHCAKEAEKYL